MTTERATGYAMIKDGIIDVRTVSPTRRAAIVNWLVINAQVMVCKHTPDREIEILYNKYGGSTVVVPVEICHD